MDRPRKNNSRQVTVLTGAYEIVYYSNTSVHIQYVKRVLSLGFKEKSEANTCV